MERIVSLTVEGDNSDEDEEKGKGKGKGKRGIPVELQKPAVSQVRNNEWLL